MSTTYTLDKLAQHFAIDPEDLLPSQSGNSGKFLTTNGSASSWAEVDALPDQTNNANKFLTTDGTDASWKDIFSKYVNITATNNTNTVTIPANFLDNEDYDSMVVYLDGIRQIKNVDYTYNESTNVLTFVETFITGDVVTVGLYGNTGNYDTIGNDIQALNNLSAGVLTSDGSTLTWKNFQKMSYTVDTTADNETITVPLANLTDAVVTEVYRNGLLLVPSDDYTINTATGDITFVVSIHANEKIYVLTQKAVIGNVVHTDTAVTQSNSDSSTNIATTAFVHNVINALPAYQTASDVTTAINNRFANPIEKVNVIASADSITINPNSGSLFMLSLSTNASITISTIQNGPYTTNGATITLYLSNTSNTISWDTTHITWMSGSAPDVTSNPSIITFVTFNGGSMWYGSGIEISS